MIVQSSILFAAKTLAEGKPVAYSYGMQVVLVLMKFQSTHYVVLYDQVKNSVYLERLKSMMTPDIYVSENFEQITDNEEWNAALEQIRSHGIKI